MRLRRLRSLPFAGLAVLALAACSPPAVAPSSSADASPSVDPATTPTTVGELAAVLTAEGVAGESGTVTLRELTGVLEVGLHWSDATTADEQLAAFQEVEARVVDLLGARPADMRLMLSGGTTGGGRPTAITTAFEPSVETLEALLDVVHDTACTTAALTEPDLGDGPSTLLELDCRMPVEGGVALAGTYDEVTAIWPTPDAIDDVRWSVRELEATASEPEIRIDDGPVAGHQQLLIDVMTAASEGVDGLLSVVDSGGGVSFVGAADRSQTALCDAIAAPIVASGASYSVQLQAAGVAEPTLDDVVCRVQS